MSFLISFQEINNIFLLVIVRTLVYYEPNTDVKKQTIDRTPGDCISLKCQQNLKHLVDETSFVSTLDL